ncbi:MAG: hypothetical protein ACI835_000548 [Planctomycetota bacterium]|jgi:hypothetical protein
MLGPILKIESEAGLRTDQEGFEAGVAAQQQARPKPRQHCYG